MKNIFAFCAIAVLMLSTVACNQQASNTGSASSPSASSSSGKDGIKVELGDGKINVDSDKIDIKLGN